MAEDKNPAADRTGTEKVHQEMGTPPNPETPRPDAGSKPVDQEAQKDAAEERRKTGGYE
ncbi:MAG TPA: hypothetical protein VNZ61_11760 [Roseomonas sp.]|nr:hypothetical protein [Roseomonas sp.]